MHPKGWQDNLWEDYLEPIQQQLEIFGAKELDEIDYPKSHQLGMKVPKGGSSCAKCYFVSEDKKQCGEKHFVKWNGGKDLPEAADEYCCDMFKQKE